jgi:AmmeMemoRadiSam system protein B
VVDVRRAAVAGSFYPDNAYSLRALVREHLSLAQASFAPTASNSSWPQALIVPHAGYVYSGPVAARAYVALEPGREVIDRIVLLGPSHHVAFEGLAVPSSNAFETPLGRVPIDEEARRRALALPFVHVFDDAHQWEHSLEVQLPFLQQTLGEFSLVPLAVGRATPAQVREALDALWGGVETVIVVSSDLSHYQDYETAQRMDRATASAIENLDPGRIADEDACGRIGIQGLLEAAKHRALEPRRLDLRSSGDTAGPRNQVVGYGAWEFTASKNGSP